MYDSHTQETSAITVDAFDRLFRKHYSVLVFFACKLTQDRPAAEDIVADIFCRMWQKQLHFRTDESAKAFLYISTRNACINHLQRTQYHGRIRNKLLELGSDAFEDFVLNQMINAETLLRLQGSVDRLPNQCRKVMRMSFVLGFSNREIAKKLQLSINTVRNQKARGIHLIRKRQGDS